LKLGFDFVDIVKRDGDNFLAILESWPIGQAFKPKSIARTLRIHYFSPKNTIRTPFHLSDDFNNLKRKWITPEITGKIKAWQLTAKRICFQRDFRFDNLKRLHSSKVAKGGGVYDCPGFIVLVRRDRL
jgi:hypothetical protein